MSCIDAGVSVQPSELPLSHPGVSPQVVPNRWHASVHSSDPRKFAKDRTQELTETSTTASTESSTVEVNFDWAGCQLSAQRLLCSTGGRHSVALTLPAYWYSSGLRPETPLRPQGSGPAVAVAYEKRQGCHEKAATCLAFKQTLSGIRIPVGKYLLRWIPQ